MTKESKRELILSALAGLLPGKRYHEITLEEVARAAQVGKGTIYLYFHDKDALFAELVCYRLEKLQQEIAQLDSCQVQDLPQQVYELVNKFIENHSSGFGAVNEMASHLAGMSQAQHEKIRQCGKAVLNTLSSVMQHAQSQWSAAQCKFNARVLLWLIDGCCRSGFTEENDLPDPAEVISFFCRGAGLKQ